MAAKPFAKPIKLLKAEVNPHLKKLEKKAEQVKLYRDAQAGLQKALTPVTKLQEWWRGDDDAADAKAAQELAMEIDVDKAAKIFRRHAGFDDDMDQEEFEIFCEAAGIREALCKNLWKLLDDDGSAAWSKCPLGSAPGRLLCLLGARLGKTSQGEASATPGVPATTLGA